MTSPCLISLVFALDHLTNIDGIIYSVPQEEVKNKSH